MSDENNVEQIVEEWLGKSIDEIIDECHAYIDTPVNEIIGKPPKEVCQQMNTLALYIQAGHDSGDCAFNRIHSYLHGYIFNEAYNHFAIKGMEGKDIYQEALIALMEKAIPGFNPTKKMSFINFAKMCIYRRLVTLLHASNNRKKDQALNTAISIDSSISKNEDSTGDSGTMANIIPDDKDFIEKICSDEDRRKTIQMFVEVLSPLEKSVFKCYMEKMTYREIAVAISTIHGRTFDEKSVDNALLRIRSKAYEMKENDGLPLFSCD